jgi:hypothetical protein
MTTVTAEPSAPHLSGAAGPPSREAVHETQARTDR